MLKVYAMVVGQVVQMRQNKCMDAAAFLKFHKIESDCKQYRKRYFGGIENLLQIRYTKTKTAIPEDADKQ